MTDTPSEIAELVRARLMAHSGAERFVMGVRSFDAARRMVLASLSLGLSEKPYSIRMWSYYAQAHEGNIFVHSRAWWITASAGYNFRLKKLELNDQT
jgi:hypothetical protein